MPANVPTGPHTPVSNAIHENEPINQTLEEVGFDGGGTADAPKESVEALAVPPHEFAAAVRSTVSIAETDGLRDIGEASRRRPALVREVVLGHDDRVQVNDTKKFPWRAHASLLSVARDGSQWIGTGWFIGPRTLITAGHCVNIQDSGVPHRDGWVTSIQVIPGRSGSEAPFGAATSTEFYSVKGWVEGGDENFDYGAIVIPTPLGEQTGWFGFGVQTDQELASATANISGYPGDKPSGTQWYHHARIASVNQNKIFYEVDTVGGQSGSAVYTIRDGKRTVVGIHAYGGTTTNSGTRISPPVFQNLKNWKK